MTHPNGDGDTISPVRSSAARIFTHIVSFLLSVFLMRGESYLNLIQGSALLFDCKVFLIGAMVYTNSAILRWDEARQDLFSLIVFGPFGQLLWNF